MANTKSIDLEATTNENFLSITDAAQTGLDLTSDFTFEAWIKRETVGVAQDIISKDDFASTNRSYTFQSRETNKLRLIVLNSSSTTFVTETTDAVVATADTWYHVAVSFEAGVADGVQFYVNGSPVTTDSESSIADIKDIAYPFRIGARANAGTPEGFFDGLIDEVRVWSDVRTAQEIADNYDKELNGDEAGLEGYWKFNDSLLDETSNDNDLTWNYSAGSSTPVYSTDVPFTGLSGFLPKCMMF